MCIAVVGNEDAAGRSWLAAAARAGVELRLVQPPLISSIARMEGVDALVILPEGISTAEQEEAVQVAAAKGIPSLCARCEGSMFCR